MPCGVCESSNDLEAPGLSLAHRPPPIVDGIEGCIGNTPLIRIKSLSEATGCDILAKAEVYTSQTGFPRVLTVKISF